MPKRRSRLDVNAQEAPISSVRRFTRQRGIDLWQETAKRLEGSRTRMAEAEDIILGRTQLVAPKHLTRSDTSIQRLIPTLALRKKHVLDTTTLLAEQRPIIERRRPPRGGPSTESRAEETETALNALLLDLFPWDQATGWAVQPAEYAIVTLLAEDAWDDVPEPDDALTEDEWKALPEKERRSYRKTEAKDGEKVTATSYKRPKVVYWRDADGKGVESAEYGKRDPKQTKKAYEDALADHLAQHPPFSVRGYSAFDIAPVWGSDGLEGLCIRQLMEVDRLLQKGYRCQGLQTDENGKGRVLVPTGYDARLWGEGGKVWFYQFYIWIDGDPCVAYMVGGQDTTMLGDDGEEVEAVINLREKWGFSRLPIGVYYGDHLQTDNPDNKPVPLMEPIGPSLLVAEGLFGTVAITAWRRGTSKYTTRPDAHVPPAAYIDSGTGALRQIDVDPTSDLVTVFGEIGHLAPLETSADTKYAIENLLEQMRQAMPDPSVTGGAGSSSGREAAVLHTYAQQANSMKREGLRRAYEDAASFLLEWACCYMRTRQIGEIPYYANVEADPQEGAPSQGPQTIMVRLREDWIGKNYRCSAKYMPTPNPVLIEQEKSLAEAGFGSFEDVQTARGKTNPLRERIKAINDAHWRSEQGLAELSAIEARARGDIERARQYEALLAQQAQPLMMGPDGKPQAVGPASAVDEMFAQVGQGGTGGPTTAQAMRAGVIGAGRGAEMGDYQMLAGAPAPAGPQPPTNGAGGV